MNDQLSDIKVLISDVSRVLLFPKDKNYTGSLNNLYKEKVIGSGASFFDYFELNEELLHFYKMLKNKINIFILTSDVIQDAEELKPYWDGVIDEIFSASKMGLDKKQPEIYKKVLSEIGFPAETVIYIDDAQDNLISANSVGIKTVLHESNSDTFLKIETLLNLQ